MAINRKCGRCGLPGLNKGICPVFQKPMEWDEVGCPMFAEEIVRCKVCGSPIIPSNNAILLTGTECSYTVCDKCNAALKTCNGCKNVRSCAFEEYPATDKYIMKTVRQGNAIMQMQVKSEEILRETCQNGCECFSEEFGCLREINCCGNHKSVLEDIVINENT